MAKPQAISAFFQRDADINLSIDFISKRIRSEIHSLGLVILVFDIGTTSETRLMEVIGLLKGEQIWRTSEIVKHSNFTKQAIMLALNSLSKKGVITKIKRGHYQKSGV